MSRVGIGPVRNRTAGGAVVPGRHDRPPRTAANRCRRDMSIAVVVGALSCAYWRVWRLLRLAVMLGAHEMAQLMPERVHARHRLKRHHSVGLWSIRGSATGHATHLVPLHRRVRQSLRIEILSNECHEIRVQVIAQPVRLRYSTAGEVLEIERNPSGCFWIQDLLDT